MHKKTPKRLKTLALDFGEAMYKHNSRQLELPNFSLPFEGHLSSENKWVKYASLIPWEEFEKAYSDHFQSNTGRDPLPVRMALASLIIKEEMKLSDRECVAQIIENPYLQYFCGLKSFITEAPFDPSLLVSFRKRFPSDILLEVNKAILERIQKQKSSSENTKNPPDSGSNKPKLEQTPKEKPEKPANKGKLLVDATCAPADITYPTDLKLLNKAREKTEKTIDILHKDLVATSDSNGKKPRTYRKLARKQFLLVAKAKKPGQKKIRKACRQQLGYLRRNLETIDKFISDPCTDTGLSVLNRRLYKSLLVVSEVYRQQKWMYENRVHRIDDRIVSIDQPHIRPIKRGKAKAETEFGAKITISLVDGFSFVDKISWDNFNESTNLIAQIESYKTQFGYYPESVHADKIYRNRDNLKYCKACGIRLSGPKLGRPKKLTEANISEIKAEKRLQRQDASDRNAVEGKFGQGKRRYGLGKVMAKLDATGKTAIMMSFIVMNLKRWLVVVLPSFGKFFGLLREKLLGDIFASCLIALRCLKNRFGMTCKQLGFDGHRKEIRAHGVRLGFFSS